MRSRSNSQYNEEPMKAIRLLMQIKKHSSSLFLQSLAPFSSSTPAKSPKFPNSFSDEAEGVSTVYRHALKFQRPTTIDWKEVAKNSASFIGTVLYPLELNKSKSDRFGVYTSLDVRTSPQWSHSFRSVLLVSFYC